MQNYCRRTRRSARCVDIFPEAIESKDADATIRCFDTRAVTFDFSPPLENRFDALSDPKGLRNGSRRGMGPFTPICCRPMCSGRATSPSFRLRRMHGRKKEGELSM